MGDCLTIEEKTLSDGQTSLNFYKLSSPSPPFRFKMEIPASFGQINGCSNHWKMNICSYIPLLKTKIYQSTAFMPNKIC
jgi:hypothetical protein